MAKVGLAQITTELHFLLLFGAWQFPAAIELTAHEWRTAKKTAWLLPKYANAYGQLNMAVYSTRLDSPGVQLQ